MDAGLREGLQRSREERPRVGRKGLGKVAVIGAALVALGVAAQVDGPLFNDERSEDREWAPGAVTIDAVDLHSAYATDPNGAAASFGGREMVVTGEFLRIVPDGYGSLDLRLRTSDPNEQLGVDVAQLAIEDAKRLTPGQQVTVSCQGMGDGGDELWVRDCAIQQGVPAVPAPPEAPAPPAAPDAQ